MNLLDDGLIHRIILNKIRDMKGWLFMILMVANPLLLSSITFDNSFGLQIISGDQISVDETIEDDDVIISGGTISINSPLSSAILFGGVVEINAPIEGDLIIAASQVLINSDVSGKIVAAADNIELKGKSKNVLLTGNNIKIDQTAVIEKDAYIAAGSVNNEGKVTGQLVAFTDNFQNSGSIGKLDITIKMY